MRFPPPRARDTRPARRESVLAVCVHSARAELRIIQCLEAECQRNTCSRQHTSRVSPPPPPRRRHDKYWAMR